MSSSPTDGREPSAVPVEDRSPVARAIALRWKHALVAFVVGTTTYALYEIGGWTVDTTVFALATLVIVGYSIATYRGDVG